MLLTLWTIFNIELTLRRQELYLTYNTDVRYFHKKSKRNRVLFILLFFENKIVSRKKYIKKIGLFFHKAEIRWFSGLENDLLLWGTPFSFLEPFLRLEPSLFRSTLFFLINFSLCWNRTSCYLINKTNYKKK